jgi:hypothetical protein
MLENRMRVVSSCGLIGLVLGFACSDERATFRDVEPSAANAQFDVDRVSSTGDPYASADPSTPTDPNASQDPTTTSIAGMMGLPSNVTMTTAGVVLCGDAPCQCNNGIDDDGDGTLDGFDVECTGAIDDDESTFATGIPGDNRDPKWQDCFFDGNSGGGDDGCRYPTECLTGELSLSDEACAVTQSCRDNCQPRTPNGCDCFGCCAIALPGGGRTDVLLVETCSAEKIGDVDACPPCVPSPECAEPPVDPNPGDPDAGNPDPNDPGTPDADDPNSCGDRTACEEASDCQIGEFCAQGCCLVIIE